MKITRESFKNIVRETMIEENEYQEFFKKALEKTGKSIPDMSDEEKKDFFNKIDSAWKGRGEKKNEGNAFGAAVSDAKEKGEDEFKVGGEKFKVESVNEDFKSVVGKKVYSDGKGKLFFGYEKEDDSVHLVDYKTWKNLTAKNLSNEFMANRLINAIVKGQKQFNKKVDYNMWSNKTKPSFEQRMDWFMKNGWISNINKGGIKESVNEIQYKDAVVKFNDELIKHPMVKKAAQHYKKTPAEIVKVLQQRLSTKGNRGGDTKEVSIDFKDTDSGITVKHKKSFNESVNEATLKQGTKLRYDKNNFVVDYVVDKKYTGTDGFPKYTLKVVKSNFPNKIKVGSTEEYEDSKLTGLIRNKVMNFVKNESVNEAFKHIISVDTPTQIVSKPVAAQIMALAKKGVRSKDIGLKMGFVGNTKLATDTFQKVKNRIYFDLDKNESVNEGKKRFKQQDGIGSSKYTISYHDGVKKHKDGSDFFDIKIFKNKPDLEAFKKDLVSKGFVKESVNEAKVFVHNEKTGEKYEVLSGKGKGDLMIAMKALQKAAPSHIKYSIKESVESTINESLVPVDKKTVDAFFNKKDFEGKNLNSDGKVLKTVGIGSQQMYIHTPKGVKMVGKVTGRYAQSLVQYVNKNHKSDLVESVVNEDKYTVIDPRGNQLGTAGKNQVAMFAKKKGGEKAGYFVVSNKNALKARRALEKFKGDFQNPKLKDIMAGLYESVKK